MVYEIDLVMCNVQYRIKKDGIIYKTPIGGNKASLKTGDSANYGRLYCPGCRSIYEFDMELKTHRVFRGNLI